MFSSVSALLCAVLGFALWTGTGYAACRRLGFGRTLALPLAPALGWAVQNALSLPLASLTGHLPVGTLGAAAVILAGAWPLRSPQADDTLEDAPSMPGWLYAAAALLAVLPAMAVLPKEGMDGVALAPAIFDHSKIALIDAILRDGTPPSNPFYGPPGQPAEVAYYYLWHFGAAQLAHLVGTSGWEADAAASWFTAFSTLMLMAGLALYLGRSRLAPALVLALCCTGSLRPVLERLAGPGLEAWLRPATGFAGWLFQSSWSPHHVTSAGCVALAALLLVRFARRPDMAAALVLALIMAAGFQSSVWVGGIVMAFTVAAMTPLLRAAGGSRRFLAALSAAGLLALFLVAPLLVAQYHAALLRGGGSPLAVDPYPVLGPAAAVLAGWGGNLVAYWLVLLVVEFPLIYVAGLLFLVRMAVRMPTGTPLRLDVGALLTVTAISLASAWLLASTVGDNNDLGWRAVLPGLMVLTAGAAAGIAQAIRRRMLLTLGVAGAAFAASLPAAVNVAAGNLRGERSASAEWFTRAPAMWAAVRRHTTARSRVANNPALFAEMTPWPVNISWALLADRPSCFAGNELALAFAPLPREQRMELSSQFLRVFAGEGTPDDIRALASDHGCQVVLLTVLDGAWKSDPFAASPLYRLAESAPDAWRVYVLSTPPVPDRPISSVPPPIPG